MSPLFTLLTLAFIGSVAGLIGGVIFFVREKWCKPLVSVATPLAAGVLLSLSLLDLFPEAVEEIDGLAFRIVLVVIVASFLVERFLFHLHHHDHTEEHMRGGPAFVVFGDTIHNFLDGIAIGAAFLVNPTLGLFIAFATFLHETPHEIADFGILLSAGWTRRKAFVANFLSALATFPGAILAFYYAGRIEAGVGILLAIAAGVFLYVAATDFLPELARNHAKSSLRQAVFLIIGISAIVLLRVFVPEMP